MKYQALLDEIYSEVLPLLGTGKVADYIPALGHIDPSKFGIAIETIDGDRFEVGDSQELFSIQSISKVFNLSLGGTNYRRSGMGARGDRAIWQCV